MHTICNSEKTIKMPTRNKDIPLHTYEKLMSQTRHDFRFSKTTEFRFEKMHNYNSTIAIILTFSLQEIPTIKLYCIKHFSLLCLPVQKTSSPKSEINQQCQTGDSYSRTTINRRRHAQPNRIYFPACCLSRT